MLSARTYRRILGVFLLLVVLATQSHAQSGLIRRADAAYEVMAYPEAIRLYERALDKQFNEQALIRLADCYRLTHDYAKARDTYGRIVRLQSFPPVNLLYYGQALMQDAQVEEAEVWFRKYAQAVPGDSRGAASIRSCQNYASYLQDSATTVVTLFPHNSPQSDFGPAWYRDGLIFASSRSDAGAINDKSAQTGQPFLDLFFSKIKDGGLRIASPTPLTSRVNSRFHEATCVVAPDSNTFYFTRNNFFEGKTIRDQNGIINLKILYATLVDGKWKDLRSLPFNSDAYSVGHPALSPDGQRLYFISDMPGGQGGTDLYYSDRQGDLWSDPVSLGSDINSPGNEMFPFVDAGGLLYFASDGHGGMGGLDIFRVDVQAGGAKTVSNLGAPINSAYDDFSIVTHPTDNYGFFASNRPGGRGDDDLYRFERTNPVYQGIVVDDSTGEAIPQALIELEHLGSSSVSTQQTQKNGHFGMPLLPNSHYRFRVKADGYATRDLSLTSHGLATGGAERDTIRLNRPRQVLSGHVLGQDGLPLVNAQAKLIGTNLTATTDSTGYFEIPLDLYAKERAGYDTGELQCAPQEEPQLCYRFWEEGVFETDTLPMVYEWDLGDGTRKRGLEVEHCFQQPGVYTVALNLIDTLSGFVVMNEATYEMEVKWPEGLYIDVADTVTRGKRILMDASRSTLGDCRIDLFNWEFSDGGIGVGPKARYTFRNTGTYQIKLMAAGTGTSGPTACNGCVTKEVTVLEAGWKRPGKDSLREAWSSPPPVPAPDLQCEEQVAESYCFRLYDSGAMASDAPHFEYIWDLGDGNRRGGREITHCYEAPGDYTVRLLIRDPYVDEQPTIKEEYVLSVKDVNQVYIEGYDTIATGEAMVMDAFKSDVSGCQVQSVYWDFGDGATGAGPATSHAYQRPGTYRVRIVLSGKTAAGAECNRCVYKEVNVRDGYRGNFVRDSIRRKSELAKDYFADQQNSWLVEFSKEGFDEKVVPYFVTDTTAAGIQDEVTLNRKVEETLVQGKITHPGGTKPPAGQVLVRVLDEATGKEIKQLMTDPGDFDLSLEKGRKVRILVEKEGYATHSQVYTAPLDGPAPGLRFELEKLAIGQVFELKNIYYDFDKSYIRHEAAVELLRLSEFLKENPQLVIELRSHTDARGGDAYNLALSQRRADAAVKMLVAFGVHPDRIFARGYGEQRLTNGCGNGVACNEAQHQANRRTEFSILNNQPANFSRASRVPEPVAEAADKVTPAPEALESPLEPLYSILLGTLPDRLDEDQRAALGPYRNALKEERKGQMWVCRIGNIRDYDLAMTHLDKLKRRGFGEAILIHLGGQEAVPVEPTDAPAERRESPQADPEADAPQEKPEATQEPKADETEGQEVSGAAADASSEPAKPAGVDGLVYSVQIGLLDARTPEAHFSSLGAYQKDLYQEGTSTWARFYVGKMGSYQEARLALEDIRAAGFSDAFVVAWFQGRKIDIRSALELERAK